MNTNSHSTAADSAGIVLGPAVLDLVQPDQAVRLVSTIGLAFLLFLPGLEVDVRRFRGPRAAGLFSVVIFPVISLQLLRSSAKGPDVVPEQAHVR